jgi:hypothetical protein
MSRLKIWVGFSILFVFIASTFVARVNAVERETGVSAIERAEAELFTVLELVNEAENAGADISGFSSLLNDAAQLLAQAATSLRVGDFEGAVRFADLASDISRQIKVEAEALRDVQLGSPVWNMWLTMVSSLFAVLVVAFASFGIWNVFKRLYYRKLRDMKPEVASDES